jgi:hypothetical protein
MLYFEFYVYIHDVPWHTKAENQKCSLNHGGFADSSLNWWVLVAFELQRPRLRPFFEKLEKNQEKLEKKAKLPARGIEPRISVWKAGLLTIRPRNFLLERGRSMKVICQNFVKILSKKTHCTLLLSTMYHCAVWVLSCLMEVSVRLVWLKLSLSIC